MSRVILIHGIAQEVKGVESLLTEWYPALCDGLALAGGRLKRSEVTMAFYGDLFRPAGHRGFGVPELGPADVADGLERELLLHWWETASLVESQVTGPEVAVRLRTPNIVQRALDALSHSAFFVGMSERLMVSSAQQVRRYFTEQDVRGRVQERLSESVTGATEVIVAHSLGTVVAYEALCAHPEWPDTTLITLGSPLGVRGLVFERLVPAPAAGKGRWPAPVKRWANITDQGDVVALTKRLAPLFGQRVTDLLVHNGAKAHDVRPYLTAVETGRAIADGLRD